MAAVLQRPSIKFLPPQLADQIAAGEVIERPASVLKELIENALDAHCHRIDIDLGAGGMERIRVTDNGDGINCDELPLAISRHATSKLSTLHDLLALKTLGFRGEALASICSVSQWKLISSTRGDAQGCTLTHDSASQVMADHHPQGTTVQIDRLFHNTPARRKFLRAERTEFRHCDDVIRRMALARFDVGFFVKHNGRQVHRLPAVSDDIARSRRVSQICGEPFIRDCLVIDCPHEGMRIWGWISSPAYTRQQADLQYLYINGRIVRDRMLNHAIRLAYQHVLPTGRQAAYVLHLEIEADRFDVNVHPTKQEVRFRETRMVHDFISRNLRQALHTGSISVPPLAGDRGMASSTGYRHDTGTDSINEQRASYASAHRVPGEKHSLLFGRYLFAQHDAHTWLVDLPGAYAHWVSEAWHQQVSNANVIQQPLLIPERVVLDTRQAAQLTDMQAVLDKLGIDLTLISMHEAVLRFIPAVLSAYRTQSLITALLAQPIMALQASDLYALLQLCALDEDRIDSVRLLAAVAAETAAYAKFCRHITEAQLREFFSFAHRID